MNDKPIGFLDCLTVCANTPELIEQFNRLTGCNLGQSQNRTALERAIDDAAGYSGERDEDMAVFVAFVAECVWMPLVEMETGNQDSPDDGFPPS